MEGVKRVASVSSTKNRQMAIAQARTLFVTEGLSGFSMRKVAKSLEMSLGHLQHYFPTRDDLLIAMLEHTAATYITTYEEISHSPASSPQSRLESVLRYLLEDIDAPEIRVFFFEVWPVTIRNATVAAIMQEVYQKNLAGLTAFVRDVRTDLPEIEVEHLTRHVLCLLDGLQLYQSAVRCQGVEVEAIKERAFDAAIRMIVSH